MERLTEWNDEQTRHAYYPRCFKDPCYGCGCKIKDCPFETAVCDRLAAYEDTGLSPEKVSWMKEVVEAAFDNDTSRIERAHNLHVADKEGRCVVLPCKVGDTVWRIVRDGEPHITRDEVRDMYFADDMTPCVELIGGRVTFTEKFGKTVFLSHEEAEKALQEMEDKKDG